MVEISFMVSVGVWDVFEVSVLEKGRKVMDNRVSGVELRQLLVALKRLCDPEDPATKVLEKEGLITVNPDGIELSEKGEKALVRGG